MAEQPHVQTGQGQSEQSITIKLSEDALPVGLMPPTFPPDYVAGSVVPFFLAGSYVGETPSLPMIDLTLTKEEACPVQWWGMLYEGWVPNPDAEGTTVFLRGYEHRGPHNERKKIYMTATTPDLIDTSGARFLRVVRVADGLTQARLQLPAVHDDLLRMDGLDGLERHDEVPCILDVDHQLRPAVQCNLPHRAEYLATISNKHLISYRDRFSHDAVLRSACSVIC